MQLSSETTIRELQKKTPRFITHKPCRICGTPGATQRGHRKNERDREGEREKEELGLRMGFAGSLFIGDLKT